VELSDDATPLESERVAALRGLRILDTPEEDRFDRITGLAAERFGVPISLISLVDHKRQWFKSHHGLAVRETPRTVSFCHYAIERDDTFVITDTWRDDRFRTNPLVTGQPHIRFYAGHPLRAPGGHRIGTFNIIDAVPRPFDDGDRRLLQGLARWAECEIVLGHGGGAPAVSENPATTTDPAGAVRREFLSRMNHELRTPLNAILGFTTLLAMDDLTELQCESVRHVREAGHHLLRLVEDLLEPTAPTTPGST
jgi:hypothetical protein